MKYKKIIFRVIFCCSMLFVWFRIVMLCTISGRYSTEERIVIIRLFWTLHDAWVNKSSDLWANLIGNILAFVPLGLGISCLVKKRNILLICSIVGFVLSMVVECIQYTYKIGWFELDDLLHNTLGTLIGGSIYIVFCMIRKDEGLGTEQKISVVMLVGAILFVVLSMMADQPVFDSVVYYFCYYFFR